MASFSPKPIGSYHVFLSFRGPDVRNGFLSHLYTALDQVGIYTYIDREEIRKGEQISPALKKAIEKSRIAIVVFSKGYASSRWCLEEVAKIMECKERGDLMVFPVFYKIEPKEVRAPRESYREAIAKHEAKFGRDSEEVKRWKKALFDAGGLSGWALNDGDEAELIKRIVKQISILLNRTPLHVAKHPVGIHPQVAKLESMMNLKFDDVLFIGLWGEGGVGKTTLAKALYNAIFRQFEGSCFLANVREISKDSNGLVSLQGKLLFEILLGQELVVFSIDGGISLIQERLCHKKVLLILDDVDDVKQLDYLAGECRWFGEGSRIIITSRDRHLLASREIDEGHIYEVKTLEGHEALELFNKHAFGGSNKTVIRRDLLDSALQYANGLPLALEVLGSFLHGRREHEWESALNKLAKSPNEKINEVLKLSYDGLEYNEKEIFLDIACFFKRRTKKYIMQVLDGCDFETSIGIEVLVEKSLIFEYGDSLWMHDLIQMMGMDIIRQECRDDPRRRSRLWLCDDVRDVLLEATVSDVVKAIVLNLPKPEEIYICPDAFTNLKRLRVLIMINVHNSFQGPVCLPNGLRWFEWPECAWIPKFSSGTKRLVGLGFQKSNIPIVREQFKEFKKLKFLNFSECQSLIYMPDLNCTPNLEELDLHGCKNLEYAHESVAYHDKLRSLNLSGCSKLHHLCNVLQANSLESLDLSDCSKLQTFPDIPDKNEGLRKLYLDRTPIKELPASIENLVSLERMTLNFCKKLTILPSSIYKLQNLIILTLSGCSKLINFPKEENSSDPHMKIGFPELKEFDLSKCNISEVEFLEKTSCFPSLASLNLSGNNIRNLSACGHLHKLRELDMSYNRQLQEILEIPGGLHELSAISCESLSKFPSDMGLIDGVNLSSCYELVRSGYTIDDFVKPEQLLTHPGGGVILPGGEMPKWLLPNKEGFISFFASKDLYKKILRLVICVVFRVKEGKKGAQFEYQACVNGKSQSQESDTVRSLHSDHVVLAYDEPNMIFEEVSFGPDDYWSHFQFSFRVLDGAIVKKCGFRLICKKLENDLEVLFQDNQLLDPALLYEVLDESQRSKEEDSSSQEEDSSSELFHKELNTTDFSVEKHRYSQIPPAYRNVLPEGEMPEQFVLVEDDTISFMASEDIYDKFLGLALCVVFAVEDGEKDISFDIVPYVNDQRRNVLSGTLRSFDFHHRWIQYLKSNVLWGLLEGGVDFGQFDESYLRFSLRIRILGGMVKKLGYVIRCRQLEGDLKVVLEDKKFVDPAALCEDSDGSTCSREFLRKCHLPIEELQSSESESENESESESEERIKWEEARVGALSSSS